MKQAIIREPVQAQVRVRALFPHSLLQFDLPADTRKADLARLVEGFRKSRGAPLSVNVILPCRQKPSRLSRRNMRFAASNRSS